MGGCPQLKAPFPWFGGKSRVAHVVWERFGNVPNYVEPFAGSLAVLLRRPHPARTETVNDRDCYLSNFWRSVTLAPAETAYWADYPVNEADLHARHRWLVDRQQFRERMMADPEFFDAKIAGWWVWGICQWIGSGWCERPEWKGRSRVGQGRGIHRELELKRPAMRRGGVGVTRVQLPDLSGDSGATGRGVHASGLHRKMPLVGERGDGRGVLDSSSRILDWFAALQARLRHVRVCCGDWSRVLGPSPTTRIGLTAVFLDPPYDMRVVSNSASGRDGAAPTDKCYTHHDNELSAAVRTWALENGDNRDLRIALCGYEGEHEMPARWECVPWKANGGYSNQGQAAGFNPARERIWFSPHCLRPTAGTPEPWPDDRPLPSSLVGSQASLMEGL